MAHTSSLSNSLSRSQLLANAQANDKKDDGKNVWGASGKPSWTGEAWSKDDGLLLGLPVFDGCGPEFKRLILRAVRVMEYEAAGCETWYDRDNDKICQLENMPEEFIPPLLISKQGQKCDPHESICCGGDFDARLVMVTHGTVLKLVGDAPSGGLCVVRTLRRGDCDGLTEFLGVGTEQRTCALKAGPDGATVRFVQREAITKLLAQNAPPPTPPEPPEPGSNFPPAELLGNDNAPGTLDDDDRPKTPVKRWPAEIEYFKELSLDTIEALPHDAARRILSWAPSGDEPLEYMKLPGQNLFVIDDSLGLKSSGPLPEGIEDRYFLDGQIVLRPEVPGDCAILILRGYVEAEVPEGCGGTCLPALAQLDAVREKIKDGVQFGSWLGDGRREIKHEVVEELTEEQKIYLELEKEAIDKKITKATDRVYISTLVLPNRMKDAKRRFKNAAEAGKLPEQDPDKSGDWSWEFGDPNCIVAIELLEKWKMLSSLGEQKAEAVRLFQHPPQPPPPPLPRAVLGSGAIVGELALLGLPVVLGGAVRAKGPCLLVVLHRHILLEALSKPEQPEYSLFKPEGVKWKETLRVMGTPPAAAKADDGNNRDVHLGPATGPPSYETLVGKPGPAAGTTSAWRSEDSPYCGRPGADSMWLLLLNSLRSSTLLWGLLHDAPPRLLEGFVQLFEPRWLLPNEIVVADEEPDCNFLFVVIHGSFIVMLEGAEIDRIGQGAIQGEAQLLGLCDWTRSIIVDPKHQGEAMIQILRRDRLLETLSGHPVPKMRLREVETDLKAASEADWKILQDIPTFRGVNYKPFLARLFKDADILMYSPGDHIAVAGRPGSSLVVILAGSCRAEQPQTLFSVELEKKAWCFQNNYLGNENLRDHDLVVTSHTMVLTLHRHTLLNAVVAHPVARTGIMENETWRGAGPQLGNLRIFESVPAPVTSRLLEDASPRYYRQDSLVLQKETAVEDDCLLLILRGDVQVSIMGIDTRKIGPGETIGLFRYLDLPMVPSPCEFTALSAVDALCVPRGPMFEALEDDRYDDDVQKFKQALKVFGGGEVQDQFGFAVGGGGVFATDCVERSDIFAACSEDFRSQIPKLVEDREYFPGEKIFKQGEDGDVMYFIQAGRVRLKMFGIKGVGEVADAGATIGDMAVLGQTPGYTQTAIAETHVWARALHKKLLDRALASFPGDERRVQGSAAGGKPGLFDDD